jgi:hypothetical protein
MDSSRDTTAGSTKQPGTTDAGTAALALGRLTISNLPPGGVITRNGTRVRGPRLTLEPNRNHVIRVEAPGYVSFSYTARLTPGEQQTLPLNLQRSAVASADPARPPNQPQSGGAAPQPGATNPQPGAANPPAGPAASATGILFIGSRPATASMTINGRPMSTNPVTNHEVPAGAVRIQFRWTSAAGVPRDTTVVLTVEGGATVRRNIPLNMGP